MCVIAVAGDEPIACAHRCDHARKDRFLADVEMAETAELLHGVELAGLLLETTHQHHLLEPAHVRFLAELLLRHALPVGLLLLARGGLCGHDDLRRT